MMITLDSDVLTGLLRGDAGLQARLAAVPEADQSITIIVAEEILRGRLNSIRQASAGRGRVTVEQAYALLQSTIGDLQQFAILPYSARAEVHFQACRRQKIRVGTRDLRIAAIAMAENATLVTRNVRDFGQVPGLTVEVW